MKSKAEKFMQLHLSKEPFIMANAWNAGSAVLLEDSGFDAIGTTSNGIAFSHALPDAAAAVPFELALAETQKIAEAVKIPVSMDAENGYGDSAESVTANMLEIIATGVVGANIEDFTGNKSSPLYESGLAVDRIRAAKNAVKDIGYPFVLTARTDCFLAGYINPLHEAITRINKYREAGADCLFVPGISDIKMIKTLVKETDAPISVVMGLTGAPISVNELKDAGVARISIGGSLARATFGLIRNAAKEILEEGTFDYSKMQISDGELCELFTKRRISS